ncbi:hypothetical protein AGOR_G00233240 [Albula goreensis]|uniref:Integrator complex subunit 12 n=1 Tax=Albula goreensis TaxID=1534307 RepID=A0A8T3CIG3_9TELE|nr:hypothetical protein AGOR_G00233240 [Albula goreensis]
MSATVNLELDPIFLKGLGYLHSKSKDSAEKLKALLDESLARGSDSSYRTSQKEVDVPRVSVSKVKVDLGDGAEPPKKPRLEKQENRSSPITVQTSKDLALADLSSFDETSADDFAMEMGLACVVCRQMTVTSGNQLVECQECHNLYHQECHKPQVTDKDVNDPRLVWYCARCTRQMKRMAQKTQKPPQKASPSAVSAAPVVKDTLVKKSEVRPKQDTASTFQAFKRTEVKASTTVTANPSSSSSIPSSSGLTGWAAFGAKTATTGPTGAKLGSGLQGSGGKASTAPSIPKPPGLSGLAGAKAGLATKASPGSSAGSEGPSPPPLKPPPPLILGKPGLNRSSSSDSVNKVGVSVSASSQPSSSGNGSSGGNGNSSGSGSGGNNNNNNNGAKAATEASAGGKTPTTQESQLNAMKRLQMVKKKAAQKKLKK